MLKVVDKRIFAHLTVVMSFRRFNLVNNLRQRFLFLHLSNAFSVSPVDILPVVLSINSVRLALPNARARRSVKIHDWDIESLFLSQELDEKGILLIASVVLIILVVLLP